MTSRLPEGILLLHFAYVLFCVGGEAFILLAALGERVYRPNRLARSTRLSAFLETMALGVRNRTFRLLHLLAVGIVGVEGAVGVLCPLTVWEYELRRAVGQRVEEEIPLLSRIIRRILFYDFPPWVFTALYVGFALLVLATYLWIPPLRRGSRKTNS
jgi:hypothetical protein